MIDELIADLCAAVSQLPRDEQIEALNRARTALHDISPFFAEPVDLVLWVSSDTVRANDYNPNSVAPPEMALLETSIEADGYTQPIVAYPTDDGVEVVDGFHRHRVGRESDIIRNRVHGYLPITRINADRQSRADRMAATIRHNRARGKHSVDKMSAIVRGMHEAGWSDNQIRKQLGMDLDEVIRLKQITGLASLFADREFSAAWEPA